ncbi:uncharacterized protein LOC130413269 isoform X1 [Triplophysa dalaica]|uniref:uncharacterized protein LOC130413269 isoform X1 n=1 Tax=Triplophysa dalaica TaxID=1582913 RepID=UPI0024DFC1F1|nr:uncharacterized protein LOC130413269 isoform X1 [Triplophysa dalaica]
MAERATPTTLYPPSKRIKSEVWRYFGFRTNAEGSLVEDGFPICKKCGRKIAAKQGNTSNMFAHIRNHHPSEFMQITMSLSNKEKTTPLRARLNNRFERARYLAKRRESSSSDVVELNSQQLQESPPVYYSSENDCSSVTHDSPERDHGWMKQEPKNETIQWENINSDVPADAEQDSTSNAISSTSFTEHQSAMTPMEVLLTNEMLTITKLKCLLENRQEKIDTLEQQVQDLQEDRKFLRTQIEKLTNVLTARFCEGVEKSQEKLND